MATILEDTRQKAEKHIRKHSDWKDCGVSVVRCKLPFGDYCSPPKVSVDTKQDITEIAQNMCSSAKEKKRFREECKAARDAGTKLVFLIEDKRFESTANLYGKKIYMHNGMTIEGDQLAKAMAIMEERYGCEFWFCDPKESARVIMELLE